jgi:rhamnosyl/mannosyltransferase
MSHQFRVVHVGKYGWPYAGGIETFMHDLIGAQVTAGHQVRAVVHGHALQGQADPGDAGYPIYRASTFGSILHAPLSPGYRSELQRALVEGQPEILHIHMPNPSAFALLTLRSAASAGWVVHWHSDVLTPGTRWAMRMAYQMYRRLERRLLERADRIICTSPPYAQASVPLRRFQDKIEVIPLGLSARRLRLPNQPALQWGERCWRSAGLRVLCVGRMTPYKGQEVLVRAMVRLPVATAQAILVGTGPQRAAVERVTESLNLGDCVQLAGQLDDERLAALLSTCDVLVLPSLDRNEAFGMVLLEAMAFGKPVIASDVPGSGPGWLVRRCGAGVVVGPGDFEDLAKALCEMGQNASAREAMGRKAMASAPAFRIEAVERCIASVYGRLSAAVRGTVTDSAVSRGAGVVTARNAEPGWSLTTQANQP